jgi:hypothetical protein
VSVATPSNLKYKDIGEYAEKIGSFHGIYDREGRADVKALVRALGGDIQYSDVPESLEVGGPGNFVVNIPTHTSDRRDRFTIAHELAHYFLHYRYPNLEGRQTFGRGGRNRAETEANVFASSLLMPEAEFMQAFRELNGDEWRLARRFDVSPAAAGVRAQVLGLKA